MSVPVQAAEVPDLPSPPFIAVDGIPNFRDLGGYAISASPNHSVRTRTIYRSGEPSRVTKNGILTMQNLGITHVYDLRSNVEIERAVAAGRGGVVEWEGCERVFVPIFPDTDYGPERMALAYKNYAADGTEVTIQESHNKETCLANKSFRDSSKLTLIFSCKHPHLTRRSSYISPMNLRILWLSIVLLGKTVLD